MVSVISSDPGVIVRSYHGRAFNRLKDSIRELVMSVPTLRNEKNPSKAVIIKKASDYVQASKRNNERLARENTEFREQVAQLQMYVM